MKPQDVLDAVTVLAGRFGYWLAFEQNHEEVLNKAGEIVAENVAGDSGGTTFDGVDQSSHKAFPFQNPTPEAVVEAYLADWIACRASELPEPLGEVVANYSVNTGSSRAIKLLQAGLGVAIDGNLGPKTLAAANSAKDPLAVALAVIGFADAFYKGLAAANAKNEKFLKGWLNRDTDLAAAIKAEPDFAKPTAVVVALAGPNPKNGR